MNVAQETEVAEKPEVMVALRVSDNLCKTDRWDRDVGVAAGVIYELVAEGETLKKICKSRGWPYSVVAKWIASTPEIFRGYELALRLWADSLAVETVEMADGTDATETALGKLRVDTRLRLASRLDRARYGDKVEVSGKVEHSHSLIGILGGLDVLPAPVEKVVEDDGLI